MVLIAAVIVPRRLGSGGGASFASLYVRG